MNKKAMSKLFVTILIAVVLIIAFVVPLAIFSLISSDPSISIGPSFAIDDPKQTGRLGAVIRVTDTMQPTSATIGLFLLNEVIPSRACVVTGWIAFNTNSVSGPILVSFTSSQISGAQRSTQTYNGQAQNIVEIVPGDYLFGMGIDCPFPQDANSFVWKGGSSNQGTAGVVRSDVCEDYDQDGIWNCPRERREILHIVVDGISTEEPPVPPTGEPTITEDGEPGLIDTGFVAITPEDTAQATTQIIIGIIVLIVGIFFMGVGTRGGTVILTAIGFILIIVGLAIIAFGAIPFFAPALAIRKENASNNIHGKNNSKCKEQQRGQTKGH